MAAPPGSSSSSSRLQQMLQSAVQAVQWTYSLFWQVCPQQGILVWGDGYYNGAIKTRKTVQPMEVTAEEASLQRSQQLRELYDSLSAEETNQPARRPCAALSPEDLTESEWFYLMSVSFSFPPGVGLPGKAFARQQHVWLLGANEADSKIFSRAILAKSAGVQTVLCIPLMDGVVELGTTERVQEDLGFIQHIKSFFVDPHHHQLHHHPNPAHSEHSTSTPTAATSDRSGRFHSPSLIAAYRGSTPHPPSSINTVVNDEEEDDEEEDDDEEEEEDEDAESNSEVETGRNSHPFCSQPELHPIPLDNHPMNQSLPAKPSELMQIDMSEDIRLGSPDDASNNFESDLQLVVVSQQGRQTDLQTRSESAHRWSFLPSQLDNGLQPPVSESLQIEELTQDDDDTDHYSLTVSTILQHSSSRWSESSSVNYAGHSSHHSSAFSKWTDRADDHHVVPVNTVSGASSSSSQSLLKHILFSVPYLHAKHMTTPPMTTARLRKSASQDEFGSASHVLAERRRREKLNERFITLRSLVPFVTKMDKASILGDTIEYVKQLRRRIQDLESRGEQQRSWRGGERKKIRLAEEGGGGGGKSKVVEGAPNLGSVVQVSIIESDALLELKCAYRESILLEIIQALWELGMEILAVQSSSANGVFVAELRAKVKENGSGRKATISEVKREMYQIISQTY